MSEFYGVIRGGRGESTRCGTKKSGLEATAASYSGCVKSRIWDQDGVKMVSVWLDSWEGSSGKYRPIYRGPVNPDVEFDTILIPMPELAAVAP